MPSILLSSNISLFLLVGTVVAIFSLLAKWTRSTRLRLPPGPKPLPIVGNMFDMPLVKPWKTYREWCNKYGDLIYLDLPFRPTLVAGSAQVVTDLLEKRSHIYSDRTVCRMDELMSWDFNFGFMPYGAEWRAHRRCFHQYFNQAVIDQYLPVQVHQTRLFLRRALAQPRKLPQLTRLIFAGTILKIVYGMDVDDLDNDYVRMAQMAMEGQAQAHVPGAYWVEYFPILKRIPSWVPGANFQKLADEYRPIVEDMAKNPYEEIRRAVLDGTATPSVAQILITKTQEMDEGSAEKSTQEGIIMGTLAIAYAAAADTSTSGTLSFLVAMALHPHVQKKAQAQLDALIGSQRLPEPGDIEDLVYIQAILLETLRWKPIVPLGLPHAVTQDDEYNGYFIPKGTVVLPNVWAIFNNPDDYPEPEKFIPERFIKDGKINPEVRNPSTILFGFGRRVCPGRHLANVSLLLAMSHILHVFDVIPAPDENGNLLGTDFDMTTGLVSMPMGVPCALKPRSATAESLIRESSV